jgi:polar amino acid transport system substrate-binding protein
MMKKTLCLAFLAMMATSALAEPTLTKGKISFAADFAAAPNQFIRTDGQKDGLNVDMCGEIGKRLGQEVEWTNLAFPGLVPGLQAKRFDSLCTAIFINPDRLKIMNMIAYVQWGEGLMVPKGNPGGISCEGKIGMPASYNACFDGLAGKVVSVAAGGTTNKNLQAQSDRMVAAGKKAIDIRAFDSNSEAIQAAVTKQVDAAYLNDPQAAYYISTSKAPFDMAFTGNAANRLAIATLKDNAELANMIVKALEAMRADGTYNKIVEKWGVAPVDAFVLNPQ